MANNNHVTVEGLLIRFEERVVGSKGNRVANLSIVISKPRKKNPQTGQYENQDGTFVDIEAWNLSPNLVTYLGQNQKNCIVACIGRLEMDTWEQNGQKRSKLKVVGDTIAAKPKPQRRDDSQGQQQSQQAQPAAKETVNAGGGGGADADIPF